METERLSEKRTNEYLEEVLYDIWESHFADVPRKNLVLVHFGKYSKSQLGCIKWARNNSKIKGIYKKYIDDHEVQDDKRISIITITRYFQDLELPDFLPRTTIAHELVHYTHGFNSPLPRLFDHPHRGNIVNKELIKRGMGDELEKAEKWLKENWVSYLRSNKSF